MPLISAAAAAAGALLLARRGAAAPSRAAAAFRTQPLPVEEHAVSVVAGEVPPWLRGTLYRNVPNTYEAGADQVWSWVDALGSIHSLKFNGSGGVLHQARDSETKSFKSAKADGAIHFGGLYMTPTHAGPRPTGGHLPFPCNGATGTDAKHGGACVPDPFRPGGAHRAEAGVGRAAGGLPTSMAVNPNVDVARYVAQNGTEMFLGLTDQAMYVRFDGETVATVDDNACPFADKLCKGLLKAAHLSAAHEKYDFDTGEHFNFVAEYSPVGGNTYQLVRYQDGSDNEFSRWVGPTFGVKNVSFIHSSHLTKNYFILQQPPAFYNFMDLMEFKPAYNASKFDPDVPTVWHVLDRTTGKRVAVYDAANVTWKGRQLTGQTYFRGEGVAGSIFHTHTVNAFEGDDGSITMDFVGWPDMSIFYGISLELMVDNPRDYQETWEPGRLTRCVIRPGDGSVTCEIVVDKNFGLPNFNVERYQARPYRFAYGCSIQSKASDFVDQIVKVDIDQRNITHIWHEDGFIVMEPVFVARPDGTDEDDGVLISTVFDYEHTAGFIVILDAKDFHEEARISLAPNVIGAHYHGKFCKAYGDRGCAGS